MGLLGAFPFGPEDLGGLIEGCHVREVIWSKVGDQGHAMPENGLVCCQALERQGLRVKRSCQCY